MIALEMSKALLPKVLKLPIYEACFVLMPLMHSEVASDVETFVRYLQKIIEKLKI